jgi:DNA polymerase-4
VTVRVRFGDLRSVTHAVTLPQPVAATAILADVAEELVRDVLRSHPEERVLSLLAISVSHIEEQPVVQLDLPLGLADESRRPGAERGLALLLADRAVDAIRDRFGPESVGYASVALDGRRSVPDDFRKLAERQL